MGLSNKNAEKNIDTDKLIIKKKTAFDKVVALAGNPNVGKSTIFNSLTGLNQHTGNWPGKTVTNAQGYFFTQNSSYVLVDLPGTYSLFSHSAEEEVARNFLCFENPDACIVICDATCLERNLNLVLQTLEITDNVIVCVNLMDEAKRKHIKINLKKLSDELGVPVIGTSARKKGSLAELCLTLDKLASGEINTSPKKIKYPDYLETALAIIEEAVSPLCSDKINPRWLSLRLFDADEGLKQELTNFLGFDIFENDSVKNALSISKNQLEALGITLEHLKDIIVTTLVSKSEEINSLVCKTPTNQQQNFDRKVDRLLTGKWTGYPIMILLLAFIFWLTICGANYPSEVLSSMFSHIENYLFSALSMLGIPLKVNEALTFGVFRVLSWVVSVMLPPMAIFFPLFTLLEDIGYLPRIAYNLDKPFKKCSACGKQALTMCMGFGCNAAGVVGCRIIDSPRERLIAILTNNFVPCNGRFPAMISIITMFFIGASGRFLASVKSATILTLIILLGILMTFLVSALLSKTILSGVPSSFTLELPPYRPPQVGKILVRSIFDRTLFVLGRAVSVAAPAGLIIWLLANITVADATLLKHCSSFLDPLGMLMGMDGIILMAFILGFPANEIVIPLAIMAYASGGSLTELENTAQIKQILLQNGWTNVTACCTMLFSLMHWPCSTTMLTIKKETNSIKWTLLSFILPTAIGILLCICVASFAKIF